MVVLSSGKGGWSQTRNIIFVNATAVKEHTQAWLALAAVAGAQAATGHSFPRAPLCISRSQVGLSSSESTRHYEVLCHILARDVKAFGSPAHS